MVKTMNPEKQFSYPQVKKTGILLLIIFQMIVHHVNSQPTENPGHTLWYDRPATNWNEALPVGNGRLAAMVFGGPSQEQLQLNEETVWAGEPGNNIQNTGFYEAWPRINELIFQGNYKAAQDLALEKIPREPANNNYGMPYQAVGTLFIKFPGHDQVKDYYRGLDIREAIATTSYVVDGVKYRREVFTSFTDQVVVVRLTASKPKRISFTLHIDSPQKKKQVRTQENNLILSGTSGSHEHKTGRIEFETIIQPVLDGGRVTTTDSTLTISKANTVTLYISIGTNFKNYADISGDAREKASSSLRTALKKKYESLKADHINYYQRYYDRVTLDLGSTASAKKPTNVRLEEFAQAHDPALVSLYFQYGRYLLISSSQPGTQPATLQGKWNHMISPPWDSKYTVNINTEMNYWPAEITNLPEMHQPLFKMLKELAVTGEEAASTLYKARGWVVHHNTDLWRITGPVDGAFYGLWPMGGAWLSQHIWQHYLFSGDTAFLKDHYSILKGAAQFYADVLQEEPTHKWLVVVPSMSPENAHRSGISIAAGTTMDNQLVFDVFHNFMRAAEILQVDKDLSDTIEHKLKRLPPMQVGQHAQLQEWMEDWDRPDDKHRHVSHLYGLYPGNQISPYKNPELFSGARNSLVYRGDKSTGWSMGWKVNLWARLLDGNRAFKLIQDQLTPSRNNEGGTYLNLLDAHPPFQIDGNFGCTAGIAEMLIQSHDGAVHLLPALPDEWPAGKITGLRTRGGFTVDLEWKEGKTSSLKIKSASGGICRIRTHEKIADSNLKEAKGNNPNQFFHVPEITESIVSEKATLTPVQVKHIYEYDLATEPGKEYLFNF